MYEDINCEVCKQSNWTHESTDRKFIYCECGECVEIRQNKNRVCLEDRDFFVREYIDNKKPQRQISEEFGYSITTINRRLKEFNIPRRTISEACTSECPSADALYVTLHRWIRKNKPKTEYCEKCNKVEPCEVANISGEYKKDINDFEWLCRRCHMLSDGRMNNLNQFKNGHEIEVKKE